MTIATRAAAARAEETAGLLRELRKATTDWKDVGTISVWRCLLDLNTPESLLAAAMMLKGKDWRLAFLSQNKTDLWEVRLETPDFEAVTWGKGENWITNIVAGFAHNAIAATPALALIAAIAASRGV